MLSLGGESSFWGDVWACFLESNLNLNAYMAVSINLGGCPYSFCHLHNMTAKCTVLRALISDGYIRAPVLGGTYRPK